MSGWNSLYESWLSPNSLQRRRERGSMQGMGQQHGSARQWPGARGEWAAGAGMHWGRAGIHPTARVWGPATAPLAGWLAELAWRA